MYAPAATFRRTDAERVDPDLSWRREDDVFFAAGACHILAFAAASVFPHLQVVALRKHGDAQASHAIASDGTWAFDHAGWTREDEILAETGRHEPGTSWELVAVDGDLGRYCRDHGSPDRHEFAHDPWWRAIAYLARFPAPPVVTRAWRRAEASATVRVPEQRATPGAALVR